MMMQKLVQPNVQFSVYYPCGLDKEKRYHFYNRALKVNVREFGDLVNTIAPVHIKQDSHLHYLLSKFVKLDGETEDLEAYGSMLMEGVHLHPAYGGTGFSDQVRHYADFGSRMYFMEEV
nr:GH36 C-terminal domain-containing protein [Lachnospiraceae bacterium]